MHSHFLFLPFFCFQYQYLTLLVWSIPRRIVAAHRRGVRVRVVTDDDKQDDRGSKTMSLKSQGIEVRNDGDLSHMHHK